MQIGLFSYFFLLIYEIWNDQTSYNTNISPQAVTLNSPIDFLVVKQHAEDILATSASAQRTIGIVRDSRLLSTNSLPNPTNEADLHLKPSGYQH